MLVPNKIPAETMLLLAEEGKVEKDEETSEEITRNETITTVLKVDTLNGLVTCRDREMATLIDNRQISGLCV